MNAGFKFLLGGLAAALIPFGAAAQPGPGMQGMQGMGGMSGLPTGAPCAKARDPQRCEALQQAKETCKDKPAAEKGKCIQEAMPPMDCSKARSPERWEAPQKAKEACKDKPAGPQHRQCLRDHAPKRGAKGGGKPPAKS